MSGIPEIVQQLQSIVQQRDSAWEELRKIRELIRADPNESTYDEVVRLLCPGAGRGRLKDGVPEHPRDSTDEDVERVYNEFWLPIITEEMADGEHVGIMPMAVKRELYDYSILLEHVPKVYMYATGGRVSKPNTVAAAVIGEYEEALNEACDQAVEDFKEEQELNDPDRDSEVVDEPAACAHEWEDFQIPCPDGKPGCLVLHTEVRCKKCGAKPVDDHAGPQPPPGAGREDVLDALLQDYKTRAAFGEAKYGTRLKTFNGRRALVDALQEAMDLAIYLKQVLMEEDARKAGAAS